MKSIQGDVQEPIEEDEGTEGKPLYKTGLSNTNRISFLCPNLEQDI